MFFDSNIGNNPFGSGFNTEPQGVEGLNPANASPVSSERLATVSLPKTLSKPADAQRIMDNMVKSQRAPLGSVLNAIASSGKAFNGNLGKEEVALFIADHGGPFEGNETMGETNTGPLATVLRQNTLRGIKKA